MHPFTISITIPEFIWYNNSIAETPPDSLPVSKLFRGVGWAFMRTGWNLTDSMVSFRSGPVLPGHNRPEQNSFTLDAYGERLIIEPGMPAGGYSDPAYASYFGATLSQNTILVNGDPHSQSEKTIDGNVGSLPAGAVTEFLSTDLYDEVIGNATAAYQGKLAAFNRHIVYLKPDHVVILDQLESASGPLEYDSLWHFPGNAVSVSGDNYHHHQERGETLCTGLHSLVRLYDRHRGAGHDRQHGDPDLLYQNVLGCSGHQCILSLRALSGQQRKPGTKGHENPERFRDRGHDPG